MTNNKNLSEHLSRCVEAELEKNAFGHIEDHFKTLEEKEKYSLRQKLELPETLSTIEAFRSLKDTVVDKPVCSSFVPPKEIDWESLLHGLSDQERLEKLHENRCFLTDLRKTKREITDKWTQIGLNAISEGKVAVVILAGGQGSRLQWPGPKGTMPLKMENNLTLFEIHTRRLEALKKFSGSSQLFLCLMTAEQNHEETKLHFESNNFFGYDRSDVHFFKQKTIPSLDLNGNLMFSNKTELAFHPNGNGGVFEALLGEGLLMMFESKNVESVFIMSVDNLLSKVADPMFVGYVLETGVEIGNKCCEKTDPFEKVGVMCSTADGSGHVVEYSELPEDMRHAKEADGSLTFRAANICSHIFKVSFIRRILNEKQISKFYGLHIAHKKIPYFCLQTRKQISPDEVNGIKLEYFIFDVFPEAKNIGVFLCNRSEEFAAIKNASGSETELTAVESLHRRNRQWLMKTGAGESSQVSSFAFDSCCI